MPRKKSAISDEGFIRLAKKAAEPWPWLENEIEKVKKEISYLHIRLENLKEEYKSWEDQGIYEYSGDIEGEIEGVEIELQEYELKLNDLLSIQEQDL